MLKFKKPSFSSQFFSNVPMMRKQGRRYARFNLLLLLSLLIVPLISSIFPLLIFANNNLRMPNTEDWIYFTYQKKSAYAKSIKQPKILIVAGSNSLSISLALKP